MHRYLWRGGLRLIAFLRWLHRALHYLVVHVEFLVTFQTSRLVQMVGRRKCNLCQKPVSKDMSAFKVNLEACSAIIRQVAQPAESADPSVRCFGLPPLL